MQLENSMLMYGAYNVETLEKIITTVHNIHNTTSLHKDCLWDNIVLQHLGQSMHIL